MSRKLSENVDISLLISIVIICLCLTVLAIDFGRYTVVVILLRGKSCSVPPTVCV